MNVQNDFEWVDPYTLKAGDCFLDENGLPQIVAADRLNDGHMLGVIQWKDGKTSLVYQNRDAGVPALKVPHATFEILTATAPAQQASYQGLTAFIADDGVYLHAPHDLASGFGAGRVLFNLSTNTGTQFPKHFVAPVTSYRIWPNRKMQDGAPSPLLDIRA